MTGYNKTFLFIALLVCSCKDVFSILQDKLSDIGKIKTFEKEVNLNADKKRFWLGEIENTDSKIMNDSVPILHEF